MDKTQDADLEKGLETIEEDDRARFETDDDELFESRPYEENELDYEPEGAYLD
jgi:hypothetical protein